jgi:hypothetical protein
MKWSNEAKKNDGLDLFNAIPAQNSSRLELARQKGREEERRRILQVVHDEVNPPLLAAVFTAQIVTEKLETLGIKEREMAAKVGEKLIEVIDGLVAAFDPPDQAIPSASSAKTRPPISS